ncbi:MAG: hypothetical protein EXR73_00500 [Myxococcales bacterium]|nr:hypothetical protein [Myxococcales bacterium]
MKRRSTNGQGSNRECGSAMLLALGAALPLMVAGGTMLFAVVRERTVAEQVAAEVAAEDSAASGAHDAIALLTGDPSFSGSYVLSVDGHVADITVTSWAHDGSDNDGNGLIDDAAEADWSTVTSEGQVNVRFDAQGNLIEGATRTARSTVEAIAWFERITIPAAQAFYCHDPEADWDFIGTAFRISGHDLNPDGSAGGAASLPGIGTPGSTASITKQLASNQKGRVNGQGKFPSVRKVSGIDVDTLITDFSPFAAVTYDGPFDVLGNVNLGDRTALLPQVTYAKGDLKLSGTTTGCGVLLVEGNLEVTGALDFAGLVVVGGNTSFRTGSNVQILWGALATVATVSGEDVEIGGNATIQYSSSVLSTVGSNMSGLRLKSWTQR